MKSKKSSSGEKAPPFNKSAVLQMLHRAPFMSLAVTSTDLKPHVATVLFSVDKNWHIYFASNPRTHKAQILKQNPNVSVAMYEIGNLYVQAAGKAKLLTDRIQKHRVLLELAEKTAAVEKFWPPILNLHGDDYAIYEITPSWFRAMRLSNLPMRSKTPPYLQII